MNKDIKEFYDKLSVIQDELNELCKSDNSVYKGARFDISVDIEKNLTGWIWLIKPIGSDLVSKFITNEQDIVKAAEIAKEKIRSTTKESIIAGLQKQIDEIMASA